MFGRKRGSTTAYVRSEVVISLGDLAHLVHNEVVTKELTALDGNANVFVDHKLDIRLVPPVKERTRKFMQNAFPIKMPESEVDEAPDG